MRSVRTQREIALEMMERIERIVHFVVIQQRKLVMDLRAARAVIERGFIKIDRPKKIALSRFRLRVFDQLRMTRCHHSRATG